jgi:hypothetical protein
MLSHNVKLRWMKLLNKVKLDLDGLRAVGETACSLNVINQHYIPNMWLWVFNKPNMLHPFIVG